MNARTVLWRRHDSPGHEACRLGPVNRGWQLTGVAVLACGGQPCRLDYVVECDSQWVTQSAVVTGWIGDQAVRASVTHNGAGAWQLNGRSVENVTGCSDIDLNFSPSTNLLPILRLGLSVGAAAAVRAAWLRFPSFALEPLEQSYRRLASERYRYESGDGQFAADLTVDEMGLVIDYEEIWSREAAG